MARVQNLAGRATQLQAKVAQQQAKGREAPKAARRLGNVQEALEQRQQQLAKTVAANGGKRAGKKLGIAQGALGATPGAPLTPAQTAANINAVYRQPPPGSPGPTKIGVPDFTAAAGATPPGAAAGGTPPPVNNTVPNFSDVLEGGFGKGNPFVPGSTPGIGDIAGTLGGPGGAFQPLGLFGNPVETAVSRAQQLLGQNLAQLQAGFAGSGLGNSSRSALARGAAIGEATTGLGDVLAARGLSTRAEDLNRLATVSGQQGGLNQQSIGTALQAALGGGQLALNQQGQTLDALGRLGDLGTGVTGIGAQEQIPPGLQGILSLLGLFPSTQTYGRGSSLGRSGIFV
jgi:hypothetical protein